MGYTPSHNHVKLDTVWATYNPIVVSSLIGAACGFRLEREPRMCGLGQLCGVAWLDYPCKAKA